MRELRPDKNIINEFLKEIIEAETRIKFDIPTGFQNRNILYDMDKLWLNRSGRSLSKIKSLLFTMYSEYFSSLNIDTILVGVSASFSYGAVPFATFIAEEFKKKLIIAVEGQYESYLAFPSSFSERKTLFINSNVLLIRDVIIEGYAIEKINNLISREHGNLLGVLLFLDLGKRERGHLIDISQNTKWVTILKEADINKTLL